MVFIALTPCMYCDGAILFVADDAALKEKKKKDESKPPTRIPGMRDANKRQAKIVSVRSVAGPGSSPTPQLIKLSMLFSFELFLLETFLTDSIEFFNRVTS